MDDEKKKIIQRVQKLYALAESTVYPEEAKSAVTKAQELLRDYNLTLSELDFAADENSRCVEHTTHTGQAQHSRWAVDLAAFVGRAFGVEALLSSSFSKDNDPKGVVFTRAANVIFIGVEPDVSFAKHTFAYLAGVALRYRPEDKNDTQWDHWRIGFVFAAGNRLVTFRRQSEQSRQEAGLVLVKNAIVKKYMTTHYPDLKAREAEHDYVGIADYLAGVEVGRKIPLDDFMDPASRRVKRLHTSA